MRNKKFLFVTNDKVNHRHPHEQEQEQDDGGDDQNACQSDYRNSNLKQGTSISALKDEVIASIRHREILLDRIRVLLTSSEQNAINGESKIRNESKSRSITKMFNAIHNASLHVIERIISIDVMSQSVIIATESESISKDDNLQHVASMLVSRDFPLSFSWLGQNYLIKMISDLQFICCANEMMTILLPEKKTLYRNPFLIPLDLDEVMGFVPDIPCTSSNSKKARMKRVPWKVNLHRVKRAGSRILFEEHRSVYGDKNICHVFPKQEINRGEKYIDVTLPPAPMIDINDLEKILSSPNLSFDDALVIAFVRLLLGCDIESITCEGGYIPRLSLFRLARQPIEIISQELAHKEKMVSIDRNILSNMYSMMTRNLVKGEMLNTMNSCDGPIKCVKVWLFQILERESGKLKEAKACEYDSNNDELLNNSDYMENECQAHANVFRKNGTPRLVSNRLVSNRLRQKTPKVDNKSKYSPIPIWINVSIRHGGNKAEVINGDFAGSITIGNSIRIVHPDDAFVYIVSRVERSCFYINGNFDLSKNSIGLKKMTLEASVLPVSTEVDVPAEEHCGTKVSKESSTIVARVWKVVDESKDKRLQWRKEYDNGFVPWFFSDQHYGYAKQYFGVKLKWDDIEKLCFDVSFCPDTCIHQQRLHYFEKVSLDEIVHETYKTVCRCWHPVTQTIDNMKWAKVARTMKFLSTVKNANYEVDMAFFRHSQNKKMGISQFKALLLDMALRRYSSARYEGREALANLLWSTVVMLPQVNKMVWTKAQSMAIHVELRRNCAQIRISARIRMRFQRERYSCMVYAAICISKNMRRMIAMKRTQSILLQAHYYRFYRLQIWSAITCQKYWRRYRAMCNLINWRKLEEIRKKKEMDEYWTILREKGQIRKQFLLHRQVMNIQSVYTITSMFLFDRQPEGQGIKLQINTYVPEIKYTYTFLLNEHEVRESVEKIVDRQGPLSWSEMIKKDVLVQIGSRLIAKIICDHPIIIFCKRDIAEKGHLISRQTLHHNVNLFILSIYRSRFDIVIRVYEPETCDLVRTKIDMDLLSEWLHEDQKMRSKDSLSALKFCDLARLKNDQKANNEQSNIKFSIPELLQIDRQQDLVKWLSKRIQVIKVDGRTRNKIVLQFEAEVEHMQRVARKFQSLWRGKYAKKRARKQVHEQFEKHRDWESKNFFYVNTKTGTKQWNKPYLLQEEEDIVDPPDEWRQEIYHDSETDETSKYYFNPLTGQSSWLSENDAATFVQRKFRDRQTKLIMPSSMSFLETAKIVKMIKDTETKYQQCPSKLSNIVNFALLCQCIRFDIDEARTHYRDATKKSSCHPVVARAYGIFILSTCTPPLTQSFDKACQLFKQAETKDPDQRMFETTKQFFFSWSLIVNPNHSLALLNYALLHQCILGEYYRAEMIYRRALSIDPTNECLVHNYKLFEDQRYPGGYYADSGVPNTIVKRSKMIEDDPSWGEWKKMTDPFSSKAGFETFWYNEIDETSTFIEPDWKSVWLKRQERSKRISANNKSLWVEYYDEQLKAVFLHNRTSGEFVWQRPIIARDKQPWTFASSP